MPTIRHHRLCWFIGMAIGMGLGLPTPGWARMQYHWVQLIENRQENGRFLPAVSVRAIVDPQDRCPSLYATTGLNLGAVLFPLHERPQQGSVANGGRFAAIKLCEQTLSPDDKQLQTFTVGYLPDNGHALPVVLPDLSRGGVPLSQLITSGCTGCRDNKAQYCAANPEQSPKKSKADALPWLFADLSRQAARELGADIPPLWIHLGDVRYAGQKKDIADAWQTTEGKLGWEEEFFAPARPLLEKSFAVLLRGNHEGCFVAGNTWNHADWQDRGEAWLYFFGAEGEQCDAVATRMNDLIPPFAWDAVVYGGSVAQPLPTPQRVRLILMDTVRTGDRRDQQPEVTKKLYQEQFDQMARDFVQPLPADQSAWIFSHIPFYEWHLKKSKQADSVVTEALRASRLHDYLAKIALVTSAHDHQFNLIQAPAQPTQMIVGNGGVALSGRPGTRCEMNGEAGLTGMQAIHFGYLHVRFMVDNTHIQAQYAMPLFKPEPGPLQEALRVTCTGEGKNLFRPICPPGSRLSTCLPVSDDE